MCQSQKNSHNAIALGKREIQIEIPQTKTPPGDKQQPDTLSLYCSILSPPVEKTTGGTHWCAKLSALAGRSFGTLAHFAATPTQATHAFFPPLHKASLIADWHGVFVEKCAVQLCKRGCATEEDRTHQTTTDAKTKDIHTKHHIATNKMPKGKRKRRIRIAQKVRHERTLARIVASKEPNGVWVSFCFFVCALPSARLEHSAPLALCRLAAARLQHALQQQRGGSGVAEAARVICCCCCWRLRLKHIGSIWLDVALG